MLGFDYFVLKLAYNYTKKLSVSAFVKKKKKKRKEQQFSSQK